MPLNTAIYCAANGGGFIFLFVLGMIMLFTKKSIFSDAQPRIMLRKVMGIALICWGISYLNGLIVLAINFTDSQFGENLRLLLDAAICAPITLHLFYVIIHTEKPTYKWMYFDCIMGFAFLIIYIILRSDTVLYIALTCWGIRLAEFTWFFTHAVTRYNRMLENDLSDHTNVDLRWLMRAVWFLSIYSIFYLVAGLFYSNVIWLFAFLFLLAIWTYLFYYVDTQQTIPDVAKLIAMQQELDESEGHEQDDMLSADTSSIAVLLRNECEEKQLYLQPGLTITDLAQAIGTNRTYLWKHFKKVDTSFHTYINTLRINYAKRLMLESESPNIKQISLASGFGSDASFRRVFADYYGCSPTQYLAQQVKV